MSGRAKNESEGDREAADAIDRKTINARVVHDAVRLEGEGELARPPSALAWSGFAAGLAMGFSLVAQGFLYARLPAADWRPLVTALGYAVGFIIVTLGRQQLYTENTLTAVIPALERRTARAWSGVLRLWGIVLAANVLGALFVAWFAGTAAFKPEFRAAFVEISRHATSGSAAEIFLGAVPAGWLIALIVWLGPAAPSARLWIVLIIAYVVGIGEFPHVIAGAVDGLHLVLDGSMAVTDFVFRFFLPTLAGNTIGGVLLVAALNHAQTAAEK